AEAYAKRLVDYDRNSAARTTVIDDQSDHYEIEGNSWLSMEENELLRKKRVAYAVALDTETQKQAAAEAYAKRLVDYDRNSAARTTVIDDQSDHYEIEGNSWLSMEENELLRKKRVAYAVALDTETQKQVEENAVKHFFAISD
ncbi:hypothetical protein Ccrd_020141, partial [Cynara cardunculus var. scolymus]